MAKTPAPIQPQNSEPEQKGILEILVDQNKEALDEAKRNGNPEAIEAAKASLEAAKLRLDFSRKPARS